MVVADVDEPSAAATARAIEDKGGRTLAVEVDVADASSVNEMVRQTAAALGGVDILVNNAGIATTELVEDNIASVAAKRISFTGAASYTASKAGLLGFTRHLAYEVAPYGINVVVRLSALSGAARREPAPEDGPRLQRTFDRARSRMRARARTCESGFSAPRKERSPEGRNLGGAWPTLAGSSITLGNTDAGPRPRLALIISP